MAKQKFEIVHKDETILKAIGIFNVNDFTLTVQDEIIDLKKQLILFNEKEVKFNITFGNNEE
jgi:hypothetical protein